MKDLFVNLFFGLLFAAGSVFVMGIIALPVAITFRFWGVL